MVRFCVVGVLAVGLSGCGSIVRGTSEQVAFVTDPPGATMVTTSRYACPATPCSLEVERTDEFDVTFAKPGFESQVVPVRTRVVGAGAAGMAGNILLGGIIGIGVDAATGAAMDHVPNPVVATLVPLRQPDRKPAVRRRRAPAAPAT
ncbi:translation initiation factor 2 [Enterovirga sp.]|jgi:hypothetical protein|uniref:translation initiation factor 2 n=1 Tax=Enterovirga sp. TaxID=2026350 RepID=UPI00260A5C8E|nr:translation initiation factor 2 [Enterovirga sp.]MDB5591421.1 hypothetical protein [Enterovirga sp.]